MAIVKKTIAERLEDLAVGTSPRYIASAKIILEYKLGIDIHNTFIDVKVADPHPSGMNFFTVVASGGEPLLIIDQVSFTINDILHLESLAAYSMAEAIPVAELPKFVGMFYGKKSPTMSKQDILFREVIQVRLARGR